MIAPLSSLRISLQGWEGKQFWLVGKGPSLTKNSANLLKDSPKVLLNHACLLFRDGLAHFTDWEAFLDCSEHLKENKQFQVILPLYPHVKNFPSNRDLNELSLSDHNASALDKEGRLFFYYGTNGKIPKSINKNEVIQLRYFSSEAGYQLACALGAKSVRLLGIDGGRGYARDLPEMALSHHLSNGRNDFDIQWKQLKSLEKKKGVPMSNVSKDRIYVGVAERELIAFKVLEYSIHKHASRPFEVLPLPAVALSPKDKKNKARTPFSFSRFLIPSLMDFKGRAVYLDSDMLVYKDIANLFDADLKGGFVGVTKQEVPEQWKDDPHFTPGRQFSVMTIDCEKSIWKIEEIISSMDRGELDYEGLLYRLEIVPDSKIFDEVSPTWNSLETYQEGITSLTHFTVVPTQPWKCPDSHLFPIWSTYFKEALKAGYVSYEMVSKSVARGHVHAELLNLAKQSGISRNSTMLGTKVDLEGGALTTLKMRVAAILRNLRWRLAPARRK